MPVESMPCVRPGQSGVALLEALVATLIFSFGVLSLVGLQASMTRAQTASKFRADASYLASELIGIMWSDLGHVSSYTSAGCASYARCKDWSAKVAKILPGGATTLAQNGGVVTITITWSTTGREPHTFVTSAAIAG